MELNIARNTYFSYTDSHISFSEFSNYIKKGIRIWQNAKKFPADSESLKAVKIAISYRDQLIKFFPHNWKNHFYAN